MRTSSPPSNSRAVFSAYHDHPFVFILIVPETRRTAIRLRNDARDLDEGFSNRLSNCSDPESSGRFANKFSTRIVILPLCACRSSVFAGSGENVHDFRRHLIYMTRTATRVDILALYSILQIMTSQYVSVRQAFNLAVGSNVTLRGWVRSRRDSKGVTFIELNDGSRFKSMQLVVDSGIVPDETLKQVTTGSSIAASGAAGRVSGEGASCRVEGLEISVYGTADPVTYPLQKKGHTLEFLREIGHLRVRSNTFGAAFRVRNALTHAIHTFFQERDFIYVQTPIITTSDCEGAGQMFNVTSLSMANPPRTADGNVNWQQDFFGRPAYLTVSGQLEGEIFALAFSKVYTFGPTFRAENSNTPRHLAEFWMIEPEMAFYELEDNMAAGRRVLKVHHSLCAGTLPRRSRVLQRAHRENRAQHTGACRGIKIRPHYLHRCDSRAQEVGKNLGVSRGMGH